MDVDEAAWQTWASGLEPSKRTAAEGLRARFQALGARDAPDLARSEIEEDTPHLARFALLSSLWRGAIDDWARPGAVDQVAAARRLLAAGADRDDLVLLARAAAYEAVFATLETLDAGRDVDASGVDVGWVVAEPGEDGSTAGRRLTGLHEDLLTTDPSNRDGADLWQ